MAKDIKFFQLQLVFLQFICLSSKVCNAKGNVAHAQSNRATWTTTGGAISSYSRSAPQGDGEGGTYAFGFEVNDKKTGNRQFRDERRFSNGTVEGSYGYVRPDDRLTVVHFVAGGERGFVSETQILEQGDQTAELRRGNYWRDHFVPANEARIDARPEPETTTTTSTTTTTTTSLPTTTADHIDLTKDILDPTLENIINGNFQQKGSSDGSTGPQTFHDVIPEQFPIVPFQLPQKLLETLESKENEESGSGSESDGEGTTTSTEDPANKKAKKNGNDWISALVNRTREDFLENQ